jgi:hypothetical protein
MSFSSSSGKVVALRSHLLLLLFLFFSLLPLERCEICRDFSSSRSTHILALQSAQSSEEQRTTARKRGRPFVSLYGKNK